RRWPIALAAVLVGLLVGAGYLVYPDRHSTVPPATASPAARPPEPQLARTVAPGCTDDALMKMPVRDKLAQLLMVGVTGKDDARAVIANYHVGGIFIGGWADLAHPTRGTLPEIVSAGPLPAAVSVDEEVGRVARLARLIGPAPSARSLAASSSPDAVY